ncbi:MAG: transcriptional regulator [Deltaproteobacteria bacterium]|nr:transcriptional regulator [Deltaproteobacteria bacterium]
MKLAEIIDMLDAELIVGTPDQLQIDIKTAFGADLMSDVLCDARSGCLLITGLTTPQGVRIAYALDIAGIVFCRGKRPQPQSIEIARELGIPLLRTQYIMFETCGRLFGEGIIGCIREICAGDSFREI